MFPPNLDCSSNKSISKPDCVESFFKIETPEGPAPIIAIK